MIRGTQSSECQQEKAKERTVVQVSEMDGRVVSSSNGAADGRRQLRQKEGGERQALANGTA
jgi:surface antigen